MTCSEKLQTTKVLVSFFGIFWINNCLRFYKYRWLKIARAIVMLLSVISWIWDYMYGVS